VRAGPGAWATVRGGEVGRLGLGLGDARRAVDLVGAVGAARALEASVRRTSASGAIERRTSARLVRSWRADIERHSLHEACRMRRLATPRNHSGTSKRERYEVRGVGIALDRARTGKCGL
jgi:hypothetical protein